MKREIVQRQYQITEVQVSGEEDLAAWLLEQAEKHNLTTLLAHADDGVIWGQMQDGKLHLSSDYFPQVSPPLRADTLQEGRLFGPAGELHLWRDEDGGWDARLVQDGVGQEADSFDEYQILWGTRRDGDEEGFTLVRDGERGQRHAPPVPADKLRFDQSVQRRPLRLQVRHYLAPDDDTGLVTVRLSRLVAVLPDTEVKQ
jgi:CRISPR-associated protein (TIGR03984 family)